MQFLIIKKLDKIFFPLFSDDTKTYICPILGSKSEFNSCYQLAKGWKYFKYLKILQKRFGHYYYCIVSVDNFLKLAKNKSSSCKNEAEFLIDQLIKKRQSIILSINKLHAKAYEKRLKYILSENLKSTIILDQKFINYKKKNNKILDKMAAYSKN